MDGITVFHDPAGWFWALRQGDEVLGRSPVYPTRTAALTSADTARHVAADATVTVDPASQD